MLDTLKASFPELALGNIVDNDSELPAPLETVKERSRPYAGQRSRAPPHAPGATPGNDSLPELALQNIQNNTDDHDVVDEKTRWKTKYSPFHFLQIRESRIRNAGLGLFATADFATGDFLGRRVFGDLVDADSEAARR